jgi:predicted nucleic acid-binding protein
MGEPGSDEFNRTVAGRMDVLVSDLTLTEVVSALTRRLREGHLTRDIVRRVQNAMLERLDGGDYARVELTPDVHRRAEHLLLTLAAFPLRAADALHLALATSSRALSIASFDGRLRAAARAARLSTYPP